MTDLVAATGDGAATIAADGWGASARIALQGTGAACVAVDPRDPALVYAGSRGRGVFRSKDGGATFEDAELPHGAVHSIAVGPLDGAVYAGCEPSMLFRSRDGGRSWAELESLREIPSAATWSFPPRPWTSHVRWIAPSPHDADRLLVGIELGGVMLSEDGAETWKDHRPGAQPDCHALAWHPAAEARAYEAAGGGAAWSSDGGDTWRGADEGRDRHYTWALAVDPGDPDRWYVSASPGPGQAHGSQSAEAACTDGAARARGSGSQEACRTSSTQCPTRCARPTARCSPASPTGVSTAATTAGRDGGSSRSRATRSARCSRSPRSPDRPTRAKLRRVADVEIRQADITRLEVDAIANAANTELRHGGGVAGAIVRAGGRAIQDESDNVAPIELGEAVETTAGELPARWVIHAATMELGGPTSAEVIRRATASSLRKADELGARSLGLVAFGTGVGGFPVDEAARIEVEEVRRHLDAGSGVERVVFAVFGEDARRAFEDALAD